MINERIATLIDRLDLSPNRFSESLEVSPTVIHNIIKGRRSKPSFDLIEKIMSVHREVNAEWLLKGRGKPLKRKILVNPDAKTIEGRILYLLEQIRLREDDDDQVNELCELVGFMMKEHKSQRRKLIKTQERQEEIIATLKRMKQQY